MSSRWILGLVAAGAFAGGCVERRLFVRSDPPNAKVYVDGEKKGVTPAVIPFTFYGTREVVLRLEKHEVKRVVVECDAPWWQLTPMDFVTEILVPWTIEDERIVEAKLEPAKKPAREDVEALKARAEARRAGEEEKGE